MGSTHVFKQFHEKLKGILHYSKRKSKLGGHMAMNNAAQKPDETKEKSGKEGHKEKAGEKKIDMFTQMMIFQTPITELLINLKMSGAELKKLPYDVFILKEIIEVGNILAANNPSTFNKFKTLLTFSYMGKNKEGGNSMLPFLLMNNGKEGKGMELNPMMLMMMQQGGGGNNMLPLLLMQNKDLDENTKNMLLMQSMSGGDGKGIDPMMFMLMNQKDGKGIDPMMLMMMNQNKDGGGANNMLPMMLMMNKDMDEQTKNMLLMSSMGGGQINPMMLMLMGQKDKDGNPVPMDPMMLMMCMGQNGGGGDMNSMLPLLMMGKDMDPQMKNMLLMQSMGGGGNNNIMQMMMMQQMFSKNGSGNLFN